MWVVKIPKRPDFWGCPPCPLCYVWQDPNTAEQQDGLEKISRDLLGKPLSKTTDSEFQQLKDVGVQIHLGGVNLSPTDPVQTPPSQSAIDDKTEAEWMNRWLRVNRTVEVKPAEQRQLTIDEIYDRKHRAEQEAAKKAALVKERAKEVADVLVEVKKLEKKAEKPKTPRELANERMQQAQEQAMQGGLNDLVSGGPVNLTPEQARYTRGEKDPNWLKRQAEEQASMEQRGRENRGPIWREYEDLKNQYGIPEQFLAEARRRGYSAHRALDKWTMIKEREQIRGSEPRWLVNYDDLTKPPIGFGG